MSSHSPKLKQTPPGLSDRASDIILVVLCLAILLVVAYPLYYVLVASFSDPYDVYAGKTFLLPSQFSFKGYAAVFSDDSILTGYANSIWYTVIGTVFSVAMIYMTAYRRKLERLQRSAEQLRFGRAAANVPKRL